MKWLPVKVSISGFIRGLLVFLFIYTGTDKLVSPGSFINDLLKASYLDIRWLPWLAWAIPLLETGTASLLLFQRTFRVGLSLSAGMMTLFTVHLLVVWRTNPNSPCSCGGVIDGLSPGVHLWLNLIILAGILLVLITWKEK
jgi:hypothetical protein